MKIVSGPTNYIRRGDRSVLNQAQIKSSENTIVFFPTEQTRAEQPWTRPQQRLLEILQQTENRQASITKTCQLAGYSGSSIWYQATQDDHFVAAIHAPGFIWSRERSGLSKPQQRFFAVLQHQENRTLSGAQICQLAGYKAPGPWQRAIKDERFVAAVEALGVTIKRHHLAPHLEVEPATNIEEELAKDVWDMRRLKHDYPKHVAPSTFEVDFSGIDNPVLREQVKRYFRHRLTRWKAATFRRALHHLKIILVLLPPDVHAGILQRRHIEALLPAMNQLRDHQAGRGLFETNTMLDYMATSPAWTGPRPPRFLVWKEDMPRYSQTLPRPIPPDVLDQFDPMLEQAEKAMKEGQEPSLIAPMLWDALLILRYTGMRFEDLAHLHAPDEHGRNGCLEQDSERYWWIRIDHTNTKMGREHRIPTREVDGVIDAIRRQQERAKELPDHFDAHYLFRVAKGILTRELIQPALKKLAPHLMHEEHPYVI